MADVLVVYSIVSIDKEEWCILDGYSSGEYERIETKMFIEESFQSCAAISIARQMIANKFNIEVKDVSIIYSSNGKPQVELKQKDECKIAISISHDQQTNLVAFVMPQIRSQLSNLFVNEYEIGVDIMLLKVPKHHENVKSLVDSYRKSLSKDEWIFLEHIDGDHKKILRAFFTIWCSKESYLKCIGCGLGGIDLSEINIILDGELNPSIELKKYSLKSIWKKDMVIVICTSKLNRSIDTFNMKFEEFQYIPEIPKIIDNKMIEILNRKPSKGKFDHPKSKCLNYMK